ncbi:MAG: hypothetical protein GY724_06460 [Actinomycetia bacterium]|nr:hypothetical protein [Actinomycetes bacterium]MCP4223942.1 hypothetical protein [Actinomycetes bacterium]MCP5031163.1 hypothetical protein [Actinomycetes bacterium]
MERLITFVVRRYFGGPGRSWLFTGLAVLGYRRIRATTGRRELIDVGKIPEGQKIVIEHLSETHAHQLKAEKRARREARSAKRTATREWLTGAIRRTSTRT